MSENGDENPTPFIQQIIMTPEMLQQLLSSARISPQDPMLPTVHGPPTGTFAGCKARFGGGSEDVGAFIDAITVYKDCLNITDSHALKGIPMLLTGDGATWWQGIKESTNSFQEAISALRHAYGQAKPPYRIYKELFSLQQMEEKTDIFISKVRCLLSQLKGESAITEHVQLDMIYGLLNVRIREKVLRDRITSFKDLIESARVAEQTFDSPVSTVTRRVQSDNKPHVQCGYCKNYGHIKDNCRKLARANVNSDKAKQSQHEVHHSGDRHVVPHSTNKPVNNGQLASKLLCYGCGLSGYVKSNCPKCSRVSHSSSNHTSKTDNLIADYMDTCDVSTSSICPAVYFEFSKQKVEACLDSGAQSCIAGSTLKTILYETNAPYEVKHIKMTLADGQPNLVEAHVFKTSIRLKDRDHFIQLYAIPEHYHSKTLLGADFIAAANVVLDMPNECWYYGDNVSTKYLFSRPENLDDDLVHTKFIDTQEQNTTLLRLDEATNLDTAQRTMLTEVLRKNQDLFEDGIGPTPYAEHNIALLDDEPVAVPPYRLSNAKKDLLKTELDKLLAAGIIEECESPYAAPVVLVPKKNGDVRLTVDYRKLNAKTRPDRYPLPRVDDILHDAHQTQFMSTLDLRSGYHQVAVKPSDRDKTAFVCPLGTYRFTRMPFGLRNAPSTFQRLMDRFRSGLQDLNLLAYLDDLIILSETFEAHMNHLQRVFDRLRLYNLHLNRPKCNFSCPSVDYLGHVIKPSGIAPNPNKVSSIAERPAPRNLKELLSFVQACSWYRRFINNFAEIARPLTNLTRKNVKWEWTSRQSEAFQQLKTLLTSTPILRQADPTKPYLVKTDASAYAIGACLLQGEGPEERPIEYASRLLTRAEQNYSTTEREALAVVWAITDKFRGYLECADIFVRTDHQPLKWLMSLKSPTGRLARWALALQPYSLQIDYTPGRTNFIADMLSRPLVPEEMEANLVVVDLPHDNAPNIREKQLDDPEVEKIIRCFENPQPEAVDFKRWTERGYFMHDGVLYRFNPDEDEEEPQLVVPKSEITRILMEYHDSPLSGHCGVERTLQRIAKRYYWPGMKKSIANHVHKCLECQRYKPTNQKSAGLYQTPVQSQRFEVLSMDLFGPLPETSDGYKWIFIVEDTTSKWIELFPLTIASAENCAKCLIDEIILRYGVPRRVISDNGTQFVSAIMQQVAYHLGFKQSLTPAYHPESNPVERKNRDLKTQLSILVEEDHTQWKEKLPPIRFSLNTARSMSTGYTPAYLTFGRELRCPDDVNRDLREVTAGDPCITQLTPYLRTIGSVLRDARDQLETQQDRAKKYADMKHREGPTYKVGDEVLVETHTLSKAKNSYTSKFAPRRDGPYVITKIVTPTTYEISSTSEPQTALGKYHASALSPFVSNDILTPGPVRAIRKRGRPPIRALEAEATDEQNQPNDAPEAAPDEPTNETTPRNEIEVSTPPRVSRTGRAVTRPRCRCCE